MATRPAALLPLLTHAPATDRGPAIDRDLLRRFARDHDETAFDVLVKRHAPMVLGVCRRVLGNPADADDACQATFVVLARKAGSARWRPSVASWLYATARQVALNARTARARRARHEVKATARPGVSPLAQITAEELLAILDDELGKLPERYRAPVVLCCVEGLSRDEAAHQLGVPPATLKGQLERGRKRLHDALARRGVALGAALLALAATVPATAGLARRVAAATRASVPAAVAVNGTRATAGFLAAVVLGAAIFGLGAGPASSDRPKEPVKAVSSPAKPAEPTGRTYSGRVVGPDDKPIAEATVFAFEAPGPDRPEAVRATTGPDGRFRITVPAGKKFGARLYVTAPGFGVGRAGESDTKGDDLTIRLVRDHAVTGRLLTTEGKPVVGAHVVIDRIVDDPQELDLLLARLKASERDGLGHLQSMPTRRAELETAAVTDAAGRFRLVGGGTDRILYVEVHGDGIATNRLTVVNRPGFDAASYQAAMRKSGRRFNPRDVPYGPELNLVADREQVIRGQVTDVDTGKPRAGVHVVLSRTDRRSLVRVPLGAWTDKDGRYEIRGAGKFPAYMVEVAADPAAAYLPAQARATDKTGYEPITLDVRVKKGVVITGRVLDRGTGKPVIGFAMADVPRGNPFVKDYPTFDESSSFPVEDTDANGRFRVVTIPGPILLMGGPRQQVDFARYKPPVADPKYPQLFQVFADHTAYIRSGGGMSPLQGRSCQVLDIKPGTTVVNRDIVLEPVEPPKKDNKK